MRAFKIALTILIALLFQLLLPKYLRFCRYIDLALLVTVYLSLQREPLVGIFAGLAAGLGGDIVAGGVLGVGGFSKSLIGYIISFASVRLSLDNSLARLAVAALASAANTLLFVGLYQVLEQSQVPGQVLPFAGSWIELIRTVGWKALADTATAIFLFFILDRVFSEQVSARRMAIKRRFYE